MNDAEEIKLQIGSITFVRYPYSKDLEIEWVNEATDHWSGSSDKSETMSQEDIQKLFNLLWEFLAP